MSISAPRSVVERSLRILGSFDSTHAVQTISEISRRSGIPLTTAHRIVAELHQSGALERKPNGEYHVGLRLWEIASHAPRPVGLQRMALPFMQDLVETRHYPVHLAIREKEEVVFVERLVPMGSVNKQPRVGGRYPMHVTAVGQVLLAFAPTEVQTSVLTGPLKSFTRYSETDPGRLRQILAEVRRDGVAVSHRQVSLHYVAVAAPIFGPEDTVLAALSLIIPYKEVVGHAASEWVRTTAKAISRVSRIGGFDVDRAGSPLEAQGKQPGKVRIAPITVG